ncbi:hypothetical protein L211DRAFT_380193 [Terfezia boudieri ATCC MYA-4762]|uniref:Glycine zipper 2TM domain-containing protein n=1 Tax=Terfezia boudieri ATCC MYA-4762 TaxID=1051890 RepID=A0A3N4LZY8_9PEZI|nr:hypothetical protein L211DRAFT_380193 [Terfezia boudieri ATCC MYA-4762]
MITMAGPLRCTPNKCTPKAHRNNSNSKATVDIPLKGPQDIILDIHLQSSMRLVQIATSTSFLIIHNNRNTILLRFMPQAGYLQPHQHGQLTPYGHPSSRPASPLPPGHAYDTTTGPDGGPQDRGLGSALLGGVAGSTLAHKMGGGVLGTVGGAVAGALLANAASHKIKDKKKKKKSKKHGHFKKRGSGSSSSSDSDSSRGSGKGHHGKRYIMGYSSGGGSVFGPPHRKKKHHHYGSDSN